ncbi:hypothetical protein KGF56_004555 [Candida oxycetoniae]|uniref:ER membrane protein complex subunit 7 beta-sandwich domain-containing protein n=1 Tax=Candida oxycetoniae TaxID=497107 RepID=A0AAI9SU23_9ASCO|nr:uncharacterized protein KGF56_004555 [Candida oxycetoniae]KAI3402674.2 hypothetical protein KGF56_004555 [Candida oxycetoniae]
MMNGDKFLKAFTQSNKENLTRELFTMKSVVVFILYYCIAVVSAIGFKGVIEGIPEQVTIDLPKDSIRIVPNIDNYPQRFKVDLYSLNDDKKQADFKQVTAVVSKDYQFKFEDLAIGEYELVISSYDFTFVHNRYRVRVDRDTITAYQDPLGEETYNITSAIEVSKVKPLKIKFKQVKQFYPKTGQSLADMVINSPFGFIFKNTTYTVIFVVCMAIMAAPYILQYVNPELAAELNGKGLQASEEKVVRSSALEPPTIVNTGESTATKKSGSSVKRRR